MVNVYALLISWLMAQAAIVHLPLSWLIIHVNAQLHTLKMVQTVFVALEQHNTMEFVILVIYHIAHFVNKTQCVLLVLTLSMFLVMDLAVTVQIVLTASLIVHVYARV